MSFTVLNNSNPIGSSIYLRLSPERWERIRSAASGTTLCITGYHPLRRFGSRELNGEQVVSITFGGDNVPSRLVDTHRALERIGPDDVLRFTATGHPRDFEIDEDRGWKKTLATIPCSERFTVCPLTNFDGRLRRDPRSSITNPSHLIIQEPLPSGDDVNISRYIVELNPAMDELRGDRLIGDKVSISVIDLGAEGFMPIPSLRNEGITRPIPEDMLMHPRNVIVVTKEITMPLAKEGARTLAPNIKALMSGTLLSPKPLEGLEVVVALEQERVLEMEKLYLLARGEFARRMPKNITPGLMFLRHRPDFPGRFVVQLAGAVRKGAIGKTGLRELGVLKETSMLTATGLMLPPSP